MARSICSQGTHAAAASQEQHVSRAKGEDAVANFSRYLYISIESI